MTGNLLGHLVRFARELRRAGVLVTPDQAATFAQALEHVPLSDREAFRLAARSTMVCRQEDLATFDQVFERFFGPSEGWPPAEDRPFPGEPPQLLQRPAVAQAPLVTPSGEGKESARPLGDRTLTYSALEVLRQKRFEECSEEELEALKRLVLEFAWASPERRSRRLRPTRHWERPDLRRTLRRTLRQGGEWIELAWREPKTKPRPLVALADISGSMERYVRMIVLFLYALAQSRYQPVEAFVFASRLSRITPFLRRREPEAALLELGHRVVDWAGGTRIGPALHAFNQGWAKRVLGRGAIVLLISDGWDQGDPVLLAREMERLQKSCYRLIWLNPLLGIPGYQPLTRGLLAALPFADDFLPLHNLASLEALARYLERLPPRRSARRPGALASP
jgi:uncharacterized protein with von Willebrand factor type A (vWA) domain